MLLLFFVLVVRRANALPLFAFFGIIHTHLLGMLSLPVLRVIRVLALLRRLVLMPVLHILPALLVFGLAHRGTPSTEVDD
jgi:hypothetical protein